MSKKKKRSALSEVKEIQEQKVENEFVALIPERLKADFQDHLEDLEAIWEEALDYGLENLQEPLDEDTFLEDHMERVVKLIQSKIDPFMVGYKADEQDFLSKAFLAPVLLDLLKFFEKSEEQVFTFLEENATECYFWWLSFRVFEPYLELAKDEFVLEMIAILEEMLFDEMEEEEEEDSTIDKDKLTIDLRLK